jgi:hypothetical protein
MTADEYLDQLRHELEKMLALINSREHGLSSWNEAVRVQLATIHRITGVAGMVHPSDS